MKCTNNISPLLKHPFPLILLFVNFIFLSTRTTAQESSEVMASYNQWQLVGPGGGGATFIPTFSYHNPGEFFIRCDMTGSYLTRNGGRSFQQYNFENGANCFAFDPNDSNSIYVGSTFLRRSHDGGKTWTIIFPGKKDVIASSYSGDHASYKIHTRSTSLYIDKAGEIGNLRVDATSPGSLYFTMASYFFYSVDSGQTWNRRDVGHKIDYVYPSKTNTNNNVYIFSEDAIFAFDRKSGKIVRINNPKNIAPLFSFAAGIKKNNDTVIFYALHQTMHNENKFPSNTVEILTSKNLGKTWQQLSHPLVLNKQLGMENGFSKITCAEYDADKAYVISNDYGEKKDGNKVLHWNIVLKTADAGKTWNYVWKGGGGSGMYGVQDARDATNLKDAWVHAAFGKEMVQLMDIGVSPQNGNIAVLTDWYRVMKTIDGGDNWNEIYSNQNADSTYTTNGLNVTTCYGVHFDPFDSNHIAVSNTDIGYFQSFDAGKTWSRFVTGVPNEWKNTCYSVVFDPDIKNKLWSVWSGMHDIPRGKMTRDAGWRESTLAKGGVCVSVDGGFAWRPVNQGMGMNSPATSIVIDPGSPPGNRALYVTVYNKGIFKSIDDGKTWVQKNNGIGKNTCAFKIVIAENGDLFLTVSPTPNFRKDKAGLPFYSGAVYKSTDGAETWTKLTVNNGLLFPNSISIDPVNPDRLFLSCWANINLADLLGSKQATTNGGEQTLKMPGGIFMSKDAGRTWKSIFDKEQYVYDVTVDPYHKGRLYCNTFNKAAYRTDNYGATWEKITGYDFHWGHRIIVDRNDPEKIYITTYGSGVWHGKPGVGRDVK